MNAENLLRDRRLPILFILAIIFAAVLVACGPAGTGSNGEDNAIQTDDQVKVPQTDVETNPAEDSYPAPQALETKPDLTGSYPVPESTPVPTPLPDDYPANTNQDELILEPRFIIDKPVASGSNVLSGQAPPDVAIAVIDITYGGNLLGQGRSDADGRFSIPVTDLTEGNRIGIMVAELKPGQTLSDLADEYYPHRGEEFMNIPNVGMFFDSALVAP